MVPRFRGDRSGCQIKPKGRLLRHIVLVVISSEGRNLDSFISKLRFLVADWLHGMTPHNDMTFYADFSAFFIINLVTAAAKAPGSFGFDPSRSRA